MTNYDSAVHGGGSSKRQNSSEVREKQGVNGT